MIFVIFLLQTRCIAHHKMVQYTIPILVDIDLQKEGTTDLAVAVLLYGVMSTRVGNLAEWTLIFSTYSRYCLNEEITDQEHNDYYRYRYHNKVKCPIEFAFTWDIGQEREQRGRVYDRGSSDSGTHMKITLLKAGKRTSHIRPPHTSKRWLKMSQRWEY